MKAEEIEQQITDAFNVPAHLFSDAPRDRLWRLRRWARVWARRREDQRR